MVLAGGGLILAYQVQMGPWCLQFSLQCAQIITSLVQASACVLDQVKRSRAAASAAWADASGAATAGQGLHDLIGNTRMVFIKSLSEATGCQVRTRPTCSRALHPTTRGRNNSAHSSRQSGKQLALRDLTDRSRNRPVDHSVNVLIVEKGRCSALHPSQSSTLHNDYSI